MRAPLGLLTAAFVAVASVASALLSPGGSAPTPVAPSATTGAVTRHVLVISVDGLNPQAIRRLGRERTPVLHRLRARGAGTLNARTERELTLTLPNHTGMVTGRRVVATHGGHGVTWNDDRLVPRTVHEAAGHRVRSVFTVVRAAGRSTGLFAGKQKFALFERSWPQAVSRTVIREDNRALVRIARRDLARRGRALTFVHLSLPDEAGHAYGFMSSRYLDAVARADSLVGRLLATVRDDPGLSGSTTVVLTADHGGRGADHGDAADLDNYRVPFLVWGAGVARGANLYDLNADYADPRARRTRYAAPRQPVRNGDVANLATDLLGLGAVPGSEHDAGQDLDVG